jgi:UrcA family protein
MNASSASIRLLGVAASAILCALASGLGAVSAAESSSVSLIVKFADLDISDKPGARVLYRRIRAAALDACSHYWFERDADEARCVHDAIASAVSRINQPELSAAYRANYQAVVPHDLASRSR